MDIMKASVLLFVCAFSAAACNSEASARVELSAEVEGFLGAAPEAAPAGESHSRPQALLAPPSSSAAACDPNYDPCVPIDRDVDCKGGGGDGPSYVRGPVRVVRRDIYRLDHDRDRIGCED